MRFLELKPVDITPAWLSYLEKRKLVKTLTPTRKALATRSRSGAVDTVYSSPVESGTHRLICIGKRTTDITPGSHPGNEEFILLNTTRYTYKPLFLVVGLAKHPALERKAKRNGLTAADFVALRLRYNDPRTSVFVMLKHTPHCEVTLPGPGRHPVFFAAEPSRLKTRRLALRRYALALRFAGRAKRER